MYPEAGLRGVAREHHLGAKGADRATVGGIGCELGGGSRGRVGPGTGKQETAGHGAPGRGGGAGISAPGCVLGAFFTGPGNADCGGGPGKGTAPSKGGPNAPAPGHPHHSSAARANVAHGLRAPRGGPHSQKGTGFGARGGGQDRDRDGAALLAGHRGQAGKRKGRALPRRESRPRQR